MRIPLLLPLTSIALLLPLATVADGATGCCGGRDKTGVESARAEFADRVNAYVDLHRQLAAPLGPEQMCSDPEELQRQTEALAVAIRQARSSARPGDIFTAKAATFFRETIGAVTRTSYDVPALLDDMDEEGRPVVIALEVNGEFPWRAGNVMPPGILRVLPPLPEEVEYRFVGADLVLLDVRADLIVDILENALQPQAGDAVAPHDHGAPADTPRGDAGDKGTLQPCDVHPEMPACWM